MLSAQPYVLLPTVRSSFRACRPRCADRRRFRIGVVSLRRHDVVVTFGITIRLPGLREEPFGSLDGRVKVVGEAKPSGFVDGIVVRCSVELGEYGVMAA